MPRESRPSGIARRSAGVIVGLPTKPMPAYRLMTGLLSVALGGTVVAAPPSAELARELRLAYRVAAAPSAPSAAKAATAADDESDPDVVKLDPFHVTALDTVQRDFATEARRAEAAREAEKFSLRSGGRIADVKLGAVDLALGLWPVLLPLDPIIAHARRELKVQVDVVRLSW